MPSKKQITIALPNKVGELAKLTKNLAKEKVNIEAICVSNLMDVGVVRLVPSNIKNAKKALNKMGATMTVDDVAAIELPNEVGALADAAAQLQKAKINVDYVYGSASGGSDAKEIAIFKTSDLSATLKQLEK